MTVYCLDTSAIVEGQRRYPIDHFPTLWENLSTLVAARRIISSEEVLLELKRKEGDAAHAWAARHAAVFLRQDEAIQREVLAIMSVFQELVDARTGKSFADPWVIATAAIKSCTVVTEEGGGSPRRPTIPVVCRARAIPCVALLDVIRQENWIF